MRSNRKLTRFSIFSTNDRDRHHLHDELQALLPTHREDEIESALDPKQVTFVALRLKYFVEQVIPCELSEESVTKPHSNVLTDEVAETAKSAGKVSGSDDDYGACVVYCLLIVHKWFKRQAKLELWDSDLHELRAVACEKLAKIIIESEENMEYLMQEVLLKRYSIFVDGEGKSHDSYPVCKTPTDNLQQLSPRMQSRKL